MLSIVNGRVLLHGVPVTWPCFNINGHEEPSPHGYVWPYKGFDVALENGWQIALSWNIDRKYADEGTPEIPVYCIGPCDWTDGLNILSLRRFWDTKEKWKQHFKSGVVSVEALPALITNVETWPSPERTILSAVREARLDGKIKIH